MRLPREIAPVMGAAVLTALIIGGVQLWRGGRARVPVVGSGIASSLQASDAPDGLRYELDVVESEPLEKAVARVEAQIATWPDVIILGLSGSSGSPREVLEALERLARGAENAAAGLVLVGFTDAHSTSDLALLREGFGSTLCAPATRRLCVDPLQTGASPRGFAGAVARAAIAASLRQQRLRAELYR
jgi:hypothetical protein